MQVNALPKVHPHPTPVILIALASEMPFVVNVLPVEDPESVIAPVYERVSPDAGSVTFPWMASGAVPAHVTLPTAGPAIVSAAQRNWVAVAVTV